MPAYSFQDRFVNAVLSGAKKQTIRARRRDGRDPKVGQPFYGYKGMRTTKCKLLKRSTIERVQTITISAGQIRVDGLLLTDEQAHRLAIADGFSSSNEMYGWFLANHGRSFDGHIIHWR